MRTLVLAVAALSPLALQLPPPKPQNPSPMADTTRAHERLPSDPPPGRRFSVECGLARPVDVFLPASAEPARPLRLLVHFHGAALVPMHAAARSAQPTLAVTVHLGAGSRVYDQAFSPETTFERLVGAVRERFQSEIGRAPEIVRTHLTAFSAGYGAVRAILRQPGAAGRIDGILLLDGLHTDYIPDGKVLADGGVLNVEGLAPFVALARQAAAGKTPFVFAHSEIFPGTFASTTETADFLIKELGLRRRPVLEWGPLGMQQLSEASEGRFRVLGFAGNSAPDHVDHFHALPTFLALLERD